jgi:hypothetical protein
VHNLFFSAQVFEPFTHFSVRRTALRSATATRPTFSCVGVPGVVEHPWPLLRHVECECFHDKFTCGAVYEHTTTFRPYAPATERASSRANGDRDEERRIPSRSGGSTHGCASPPIDASRHVRYYASTNDYIFNSSIAAGARPLQLHLRVVAPRDIQGSAQLDRTPLLVLPRGCASLWFFSFLRVSGALHPRVGRAI